MIGKDAYKLLKQGSNYSTLAHLDTVAKLDVKKLRAPLESYLLPTNFEITEREKFYNIVQKPGESLKSFMLRIQEQATKCNFGDKDTLQTQMRDRIVAGIREPDLKKKLLQDKKLTFKSAKCMLDDWNDINAAVSSVCESQSSNEVYSSHHQASKVRVVK